MRKIQLIVLLVCLSLFAAAQEDSDHIRQIDEVVITATRTERKMGNVAVPVQLISAKTIQQSGSVRVGDVLQEQTGLFITSAGTTSTIGGGIFGSGVQIQGLSPEYTLILLDGEPMIGRNGGIFDLTRIAVGNIKKIEIVKGPSSSLYGSEAMGGVINIITDQPKGSRLDAGFRYGRFNATDASISAGVRKEKWGLGFFANNNRSGGFDLVDTVTGKTVDPWRNYTGQLRFFFTPSVKTKLSVSARYFSENQDNFFTASDPVTNNSANITGGAKTKDFNLNPVITTQFNDKLRSSLRLYFSRYQFEQNLVTQADKTPYYNDFFQQDFYRIEDQTDVRLPANNQLTVGGGLVAERLNTTRYAGKRGNDIGYLFVQNEWKALDQLMIIGGLRYDNNSAYKSRLSPKLAAQYKVNDKFRINASYGAGFKAPDFRQLFLNFTNSVIGYTIYGANEVTLSVLEQQKQQGTITEILPKAYQLALLSPEISRGLNAGFNWSVNDLLNVGTNFFRNDIDNLIIVDVVARKSNGMDVYSYFNVKKALTEGAELNAQYIINDHFRVCGGYQVLITADKADLQRIKDGVYTRDYQTGQVRLVNRSEYAGLPNRSAHMANLKLFYDNSQKGLSASVRGLYRSRWGTTDQDGDNLIDQDNEFAKGFVQINLSVTKTIDKFRLLAGIDNVLNYKDPANLPNVPGIQPYVSIMYSFLKKNK